MNAFYRLVPGAFAVCEAQTKTEVLSVLAETFAAAYALPASEVFDALEEREKLGSTGFGRAVAIPHARLAHVNRPLAALVKLPAPVDFDAADGMPVELVFGLISPENAGVAHLHALAAISRLVRDEEVYRLLMDAPDAEAMCAALTNAGDRDVA